MLEAWTPPANVQVLMTSRLGGWGAEVAPVEVEEWALDEAVRYLRDASGRGDLDEAALTQHRERAGPPAARAQPRGGLSEAQPRP